MRFAFRLVVLSWPGEGSSADSDGSMSSSAEGAGTALGAPACAGPVFETVQPAWICLPSGERFGCSGWTRTSTVPGNNRVDYCYPTEQWRCRQELHLHRPV